MKINSKIALATLALSSTSFARMGFLTPVELETKTICLVQYASENGQTDLDTCDHTKRNEAYGLEILENSCAEG